MDTEVINVTLFEQEHEVDVPQLAPGSIPPGGFLGDALAMFQFFLGRYQLWDMQQCVDKRTEVGSHFFEWSKGHYSWNQFLRENNHFSWPGALNMTTLLFSRDILAETEGGLFGNMTEKNFMNSLGVPSLQFYHAAILRLAARYDWWIRANQNGLPDPYFDPIPPIEMVARSKAQEVYKNHIKPWLDEHVYGRGLGSYDLDILSHAILYVMGYQSEMPKFSAMTEEQWQAALRGLIKPPHAPLLWMIAFPSNYLNDLAEEGQVGKQMGFFSTPMNVVKMMSEITLGSQSTQSNLPYWDLKNKVEGNFDSNFVFNYPNADTEEKRKAILTEAYTDPAAGVGNMTWGFFSNRINGEFIELNHSLAKACRATFALYAPWLVHSTYVGDSLWLGMTEETMNFREEQQTKTRLEGIRAGAILNLYILEQLEHMGDAEQHPIYNTAGLNTEQVFLHVQARANLRLQNNRKEFYDAKFGPILDLFKQVLGREDLSAEDALAPEEIGQIETYLENEPLGEELMIPIKEALLGEQLSFPLFD